MPLIIHANNQFMQCVQCVFAGAPMSMSPQAEISSRPDSDRCTPVIDQFDLWVPDF